LFKTTYKIRAAADNLLAPNLNSLESITLFIEKEGTLIMASAAQITANRENAHFSTGPRTSQGKAKSANNARHHNLCSVSPVLTSEDKIEFDRLLCELKLDLGPRTHTEHALIEQAAYAEWKLLRIAAWETELINATISGRTTPITKLFGKTPQEALDRLHRYESATRRAWHTALRELRVIKKLRQNPAFVADYCAYILKMKKIVEDETGEPLRETNPTPADPAPPDTQNSSASPLPSPAYA
jgi:hypothetical protein